VKQLDEQETLIETLRKELQTLTTRQNQLQEELEKFIAAIG
jgi:hypothetical protein